MQQSALVCAGTLLLVAACSGSPLEVPDGPAQQTFLSEALLPPGAFARPARPPAPAIEHGGLLYSAEVVTSGTALAEGPMSLRVFVHVRNPAPVAVQLQVAGCTVWPEFRHAGDSGPPAWVPEGQCAQAPHMVEIAAGASRSFEFLAHDAMLAYGLEDGRYDVTALFRLPATTLRLDAGTADVRLMLPNLAFHVSVDAQDGRATASVRLENLNSVPVRLEWGDCAVGFDLHVRSDRSDAPQRLEGERICLLYLARHTVPPGETIEAREFTYTAPGNAAVRAGTYQLVVTLRLNWRTYRFPMGTLVVR